MTEVTEDLGLSTDAVGKYFLQITIVAVVYFLAGRLGQATTNIRSSNLGPVWPASGIALAAVLLWGYRVWPGLAVGTFLVALLSPVSPSAAFGQAVGSTLAAMTGAFLLQRFVDFDPTISRLRDVFGLVLLGACCSALISASIGVSVLYGTHIHAYSGIGPAWLIYWLGDSTGVMLVTPLVLTLPSLFRIRERERVAELAALLVLLTAACFVVFGDLHLIPLRLHVLAFAVLPFVMWAAIRFGISATALTIVVIATTATVETALGSGPFASGTPFRDAVLLDVFFSVLSITGLTLAATIAEREKAERERERAVREQAAAETRLRLAAIVESSDDAIVGTDLEGVVTDWNQGAERLYGYSRSEALGKSMSFLVPPDLSDKFFETVKNFMLGIAVEHYETTLLRKDGSRVDVSMSVSPIFAANGQIIGTSRIQRDITQRKLQDAILRESEERFRLVSDTAPVLIWMSGTDKRFTYFNKPWLMFTGRSMAEELGDGWREGIHPRDFEKCIALYSQCFDRREEFSIEYQLRRFDGEYRWISSIGVPRLNPDQSFAGYIGSCIDITDRKQAEEARRESEDKLRLLLDSTAEAIFGVDLEGNCTFCNAACLRALGYRQVNELLGRNMHDLIHHSRADGMGRKNDGCHILQAFRTGEGLHMENETLWRANGTTFPAEFWSHPQRRGNEIVGAVVAFIDVTERKRTEEALSGMNRRLMEAQEQERTRIARELHDDINQRLALLAVQLGLIQQSPFLEGSEASSRMNELRQEVSEISIDLQALSHRLHSSKLEYLGAVAAMKSWCQEFGERQKMEIEFNSIDVPGPLPNDLSLCLFRVLQEAMHNASKYSGVKHIEVELRGSQGEIHLLIKDLGAGFDVEKATKGPGIGLSSMRERVKMVNGAISIASQPKGGTTVHVRVPLAPLAPADDSALAAG